MMKNRGSMLLGCCATRISGLVLVLLLSTAFFAQAQVGRYDVFEIQVTNSTTYSNPFDFNVIELQAIFTSSTGKIVNFFGFHDGDGGGGQTGNVWKLRFMPDEVGTWTYSYTWTDGTLGGSGSFDVVDTGLPGPLKIASDNPWYFEDSRGNSFHWRGYDLHTIARHTATKTITQEISVWKNVIQTELIDRGYNFTMLDAAHARRDQSGSWNGESWWLNTTDTKRFDISVWTAYDEFLRLLKDNKVYAITFSGMVYQGDHYAFSDFKVFLRYWVARFGSFYNFCGWSPTWEWGDIWSTTQMNQIMQYVYDIDPWKRLLTTHDHSNNSFSGWLGFSMRQQQSRTIFQGNIHGGGIQGGVGSAFLNKPIIGSEDVWEYQNGAFGQPRNAMEVRRGAWGIIMAGVMPLYSEWHHNPPPSGGNGTGEPEVRRMFDFFYSQTQYRQYQQLNGLVSSAARQIASGIPGQEYLVYDEDGGTITIDLSGTSGANTFSVLWFDPKTGVSQNAGSITGGGVRSVSSPFSGDSVLLLDGSSGGGGTPPPPDVTPPSAPTGVE